MRNLFTYIILIFLIVSLSSSGSYSLSAFQEQNITQTAAQQQDSAKAGAGEEEKKDGFFKTIWESVKSLFQKDKAKPPKPNHKIETRSVHFSDFRNYGKYGTKPQAFWDSLWQITPTPYDPAVRRGETEIFGWHPYWMGSAYTSYNFQLLSSISYFSYELNPETGAPLSLNDWKTTKLVDFAKAYKCEVFLTVTNFGETANTRFFKSRNAQQNSLDSIIAAVKYRDADGVTLDFELIPKKLRKDYNSYIIELSNRLKAEALQFNVAIPPVDVHQLYDFNVLVNYVDRFVVMGYGYYGDGSRVAGPEAPLDKGDLWGNSTLQQSVETYVADGIPAGKMVLSVPYVASSWKTVKATVPSRCLAYYGEIPYRTIKSQYTIDPVLEQQSSSLYYLFPDFSDGSVNQVWLDDTLSLTKKYDLVTSQKLKGVGIWALGYDNGYTELWELLGNKFGASKTASGNEQTDPEGATGQSQDSTSISKDSLEALKQKWADSINASIGDLLGKTPQGVTALPVNDSIAKTLNDSTAFIRKDIFGWHPYWNKDKYKRYRYDLLTAISYFSYELNPETGGYKTMHDWKTTPMVDLAKQNNCRVYLTVTNFDGENHEKFLGNLKAQENSKKAIIDAVKLREADGVTLNFEGVPGNLRYDLLFYIVGLSNALKAEGLELNMTIPAVDSREAYAVENLIHYVDQFIMMGYNYYGKGGTTAGPEAPLKSGDIWTAGNLEESVAKYLEKGIPKTQFILALPYFGSVWDSPYGIIPATNSAFTSHITYTDVRKRYINAPLYDTISYTAYYIAPGKDGRYTQIWFDNEETLAKKYDLILEQDLRGVGIWALGYDDGYNELWNKLEEKFLYIKPDIPKETVNSLLAKLNEPLILFLVILILLVFLIGILAAMTNSEVVESFMSNKTFQLVFVTIFLASFFVIYKNLLPAFGIENGENTYADEFFLLLGGGILGAVSIYLLQNLIIERVNRKP